MSSVQTQSNNAPKPVSRLLLPLGAFTAAALWGSAYPVIKIAFGLFDGASLIQRIAFAGIRFTLAGLLLLIFVKAPIKQLRICDKRLLFGVALLQVSFHYLLFYWGLSLNSGVISAILTATGSFWWIILAPVFHGTPYPARCQFGWLGLGFLGVCLAVYGGGHSGHVSLFGCGLLLISTISATFANLMVRPMTQKVGAMFITSMALGLGGLMLLLISAPVVPGFMITASPKLWLMTLYLSLVSALAFWLWYHLISLFDVNTLSAYRYLIPVCGVVESALFIEGESLNLGIVVGGGVVVLCIWVLGVINQPPRILIPRTP